MSGTGILFPFPIDLSVSIDKTRSNCGTVAFSVSLKFIPPVVKESATAEAPFLQKTNVEVLVYDDCGNVLLRNVEFGGFGTLPLLVNLPTTACHPPGGDWGRTFFVIADPFNKITETKEGNNIAKLGVFCLG
jgi:hypothetical protein